MNSTCSFMRYSSFKLERGVHLLMQGSLFCIYHCKTLCLFIMYMIILICFGSRAGSKCHFVAKDCYEMYGFGMGKKAHNRRKVYSGVDLYSRAFVNTRLLVHKHVKISVDEWILETTRPQKHVKSDGKAKAIGFLKLLRSQDIIAMALFLQDILTVLHKVSLKFQKYGSIVAEVSLCINTAIKTLQ